MTDTDRARLAEIDREIAEIEAAYPEGPEACPEEAMARWNELAARRWEIEPPFGRVIVMAMQGR